MNSKEAILTAQQQLQLAEAKAAELFVVAEQRNLIRPGIKEKQLNQEMYDLAFELFGIKKYWHKRIVRTGKNTLLPYAENPEDLTIQEDDILFFDFGPVFEEWEADFGRTYVLGQDPRKMRLREDVAKAWAEGKQYFDAHKAEITAAQLYEFTCTLAKNYGWQYGNEHCGHLVGNFPHEKIIGDERVHYLHPQNHSRLCDTAENGMFRHWIYEIHFIDPKLEIGGFYEQLLT